ncbi:hypothetical protein JCGZ_09994 [Jatropha curcas]|uniref:Uncharacterized protein n=1 Tax=Jatropha curcas TaxID=180498 RepID=A0A067KLX9_JATCU|nr:hypothetical protein JCGZ_09994 [Jatropha curcas]
MGGKVVEGTLEERRERSLVGPWLGSLENGMRSIEGGYRSEKRRVPRRPSSVSLNRELLVTRGGAKTFEGCWIQGGWLAIGWCRRKIEKKIAT